MRSNPTCNLKKSHLWGFEVTHIIASFGLMMISNFIFSAIGIPVIASWIIGLICLGTLRIVSIGKKAGHLGFLTTFLFRPRIYLGCTFRNLNRRHS